MTPNQVTAASLVLVVVAGVLFARGEFAWGLVAGWIMTFLDTVDGKLARVTITSTKLGNVFDHGIDLIHPPFWYFAWGMGLALSPPAIAGIPLSLDLLGDPRRLRRRAPLRRRVPALHRALLDLHLASVRLLVPADRGAAQSEHDHADGEPRARPAGPGPAGGRRVDGVVDGAASARLLLAALAKWQRKTIRSWLSEIGETMDEHALAVRVFAHAAPAARKA